MESTFFHIVEDILVSNLTCFQEILFEFQFCKNCFKEIYILQTLNNYKRSLKMNLFLLIRYGHSK